MSDNLQGTADLDRKLGLLKESMRGNILRSAVRAGIKPAKLRAVSLIPKGGVPHRTYKGRLVGPGFASRNIRVITTVSADRNKASAIMGVRREAFYATQFVETRKGKSKDKGRPWLEPAMRQTQSEQLAALSAQLKKRIDAVSSGYQNFKVADAST